MWYLLLPVVFAVVGWLIVRAVGRSRRAELAQRDRELGAIAGVSADEAERTAFALLTNAELFQIVPARTAFASSQPLPPTVVALLQRYEAIDMSSPPWARVAREVVGPSAIESGFVRIGTVGEGTDSRGEVCVRPDHDGVLELYEGDAIELSFPHPTVFHWILAMAEEGKPGSVLTDRR